MIRRSFRIGLWLGLVAGLGVALVKRYQGRRETAPAPLPRFDGPKPFSSGPPPRPVPEPQPMPEPPMPMPVPEPQPVPEPPMPVPAPQPMPDPTPADPEPAPMPSPVPLATVLEPEVVEPAMPPPPPPPPRPAPAPAVIELEPLVDAPETETTLPPSGDILPVRPTRATKKAAKKADAVPAASTKAPAKKAVAKKAAARKAAAPRKKAVPPWVESTAGTCPSTHPVKAKLASRIFHLPGMLNYQRTAADRCYVSAEAAEADGLRPSKR